MWLLVAIDKKKVLHHHPDKRRARGLPVKEDDDYFTCITRGNFVKIYIFLHIFNVTCQSECPESNWSLSHFIVSKFL